MMMKILVVDDRAENLYLLEKQLGASGFTVVSARNGVEALQKLEEQPFDMIISDILMPQMDGFQFCREVKTRDPYKRIPFVFYTATYTEKKDQEAGLSLGASRFIIKPQEPEQFLSTIKKVLNDQTTVPLPQLAPMPVLEEKTYLKTYNERLVRKLEQKIEELELSNRRMQSALAEKEHEAAERLRAEEKLLAYQQQLQLLSSRILIAEERQRRAFSRMLHDHIGQSLTYAKIRLSALLTEGQTHGAIEEILKLVDQMSEETRSLTYELSPPLLYEIGLDAALEWLGEHFQARYRLPVTFTGANEPENINIELRIVLFQAVRELLFNVVKHADAKSARILTQRSRESISVIISDDGVGFDTSKTALRGDGGFGLFNVKERMNHLGGAVDIDSTPGKGTRITLRLPLNVSPTA